MATMMSGPAADGAAPIIEIEVMGDTSTDLDSHTPDVVQVPQAAQKSKEINRNLTIIDTKIEVEESQVKKEDKDRKDDIKKPLSKHSSRENLDEKVITDEDIILAATLIQDAKEGRNFEFKTEPEYVRSYNLFHRFYLRWLLYFFILVDLLLALVEKPTKPGWEIPYWGSMLIEVICLAYFSFRFGHSMHFTKRGIFWRDTKNVLILVIIILTFIDLIVYIVWDNVTASDPIRWSRPLRPLFIINFSDGKQIRRAFRNIRRTVPEIMNVLVLFLMSVLLFALLALKLFSRRSGLIYPSGEEYFRNYFDSIWDLYVLVTTANNPDVMMPAYDENNWFALFFVIYMIICLYIFMSIVLAAIYNNYRKNLKNEIKSAVYMKRRKLAQAFEILKMERSGHFVVTYHTWNQLMKIVTPNKSQAQKDVLLRVLDVNGENVIIRSQFLRLADLLELELSEVKDRLTFIEKKFPYVYNSAPSVQLRKIVRHKYFRFFFDFMIFVNAWFIGFDVDQADWFFLSVFMLEIFLKLYVYGPRQFFKRFWNGFDFVVIGAAVIASAIEAISGDAYEEFSTLDLLLVLRVVRLIKIFGSIQRFKVILMTIINIGPSIITYGGVIFVFYYMFAIIGMEVFHGRIRFFGYDNASVPFCGNAALNGTAFVRNHYCNNNFNDILRSFVVLFDLMVVNQWHVIASGFVHVTNKFARIYFFVFHLSVVVIVLNIFIAFILEAFILEYSLQRIGKFESFVEAKIKELGLGIGQDQSLNEIQKTDDLELVPNEVLPEPSKDDAPNNEDDDDSDTDSLPDLSKIEGLRFHLKKKNSKKVEVLLQQMFEGEIDPEDEGPEDGMEIQVKRQRTITLDTVA